MPAPSIHAFAEKVALITDGADPIGRAVALQLALQGSYVIVGFSKINDENRRALSELQNLGTLAQAVEADMSTVEGARQLVGEVEAMFGRLDLLVNCLKFRDDSAFENVSGEVFDNAVNVNLRAAFFVTQQAVRLMRARPKPKIVNVLSACDTPETAQNVLFASTQNALIALTKSLSENLPPHFRVNAVAVSEAANHLETLDAELFRPKTGVAEDDVARAVVFLLSGEAIALKGQILSVK